MSWLQVQIPVDSPRADAVEKLMLDAGALSVTLTDSQDQPIFEPGPGETPIWDLVTVVGLFPGDSDQSLIRQSIQRQLEKLSDSGDLPTFTFTTLEERDWERLWLKDFKPACFAGRLWICPAGMPPASPVGVVMNLDPGLAFGTGSHPTTALCLEWLAEHDLKDLCLVDYGCGSGILGIAALLLGAGRVHGVDNDPQALLASRDNSAKNAIDPDSFPLYLPGDFAHALADARVQQADIVLANILAGPLVSLAEYLAAMVRPGGRILLSGILKEQAKDVTSAYEPWFQISDPVFQEDWTRLEGKRKSLH